MSLHSNNPYLFLFLNIVCLAYTNLIVSGMTRPELEPTTYSIREEDINHYTTGPVCIVLTVVLNFHNVK